MSGCGWPADRAPIAGFLIHPVNLTHALAYILTILTRSGFFNSGAMPRPSTMIS